MARDIILRSAGVRTFAPLLLEYIGPGVVVHADRGVGKTEALLSVVYRDTGGEAVIVTINQCIPRISQRYKCMYCLDGESGTTAFPIFVANPELNLIPSSLPIYCDDWWLLPAALRRSLAHSGRVAGAVGSLPGLAGCIERFEIGKE